MSPNNFDQFDHLEEGEEIEKPLPKMRNAPKERHRPRLKDKYNIITEEETAEAIYAQREDLNFLEFTYQPSETEQGYLTDALKSFYDQRWFDDLLRIIKGGKEASVYLLKGSPTSGEEFLAAKIYRPTIFRALKNDHVYRQGRRNLDANGETVKKKRELHAIRKRTSFGDQLRQVSWIQHEIQTMNILAEAGCDLPRFFTANDRTLLMEYIGSPDMAAPTLNTVRLPKGDAARLFRRTIENIERMLAHNRVHGDLSAYNILYWEGQITLIDFPQAISPRENLKAFEIFERDVVRICEYFQRQGIGSRPRSLARALWQRHGLPLEPEVPANVMKAEDLVWDGLEDPSSHGEPQ